ncbi:alpha/beta fold hydrolase [Saccharomonospora azurea]
MPSLPLPGLTLDYDDVGRGHPVVLLHGHPFDRTLWRPQVERLTSEGFRVIAPDLRGYGTSRIDASTLVTPFEQHTLDLDVLLDHLRIDTFVLGGLSMGGQLALDSQRRFGRRVDALVLAATSARADTAAQRRERWATAERLSREGMGALPEELLPRMMSAHSIRTLPATVKHVRRMMHATSAAGAAAAVRGRADRRDYVAELGDIAPPTLVVVGTEDTYTPVAEADLLHQRIPDARLVVLDEVGHLPNLEREADFNDHLVTFLRSVL